MSDAAAIALPASIRVFERGWLSSNNILLVDEDRSALVDTGYATHAAQTVVLVQHALAGRALDTIVNTHLHSDHCGGNAQLQSQWSCETLIPAASGSAVREWDEARLTFGATGQTCERFERLAPLFGIVLDTQANDAGKERVSARDSRVPVFAVRTDEEGMIALHTARLLRNARAH